LELWRSSAIRSPAIENQFKIGAEQLPGSRGFSAPYKPFQTAASSPGVTKSSGKRESVLDRSSPRAMANLAIRRINWASGLAHVLQKRADPRLLDTYEPERISFARTLVASTDRAFTAMTGEDLRGALTRLVLAPLVFSLGAHVIPHVLFRTISQVEIRYPDSALSEGNAGKIHGGDRLPWTGPEMDNFAPLRSLDWQIHVYGKPAKELLTLANRSGCRSMHLPGQYSRSEPDLSVTRFIWSGPMVTWP
jgi:hypothetical protein